MASRIEKNKEKQDELLEEEKREKRKKSVLLFLKVTFIIIILFFAFFFYTSYISTTKLIVKEERIINKKIPNSFNGIKIIQFSDLYYGSTITDHELDSLIKEINIRKPQIVVFTGNIFDKKYKVSTKEKESMIKKLQKIDASIGKYAVMGKDDDIDTFNTIMTQSDFNVLDNSYDQVYSNDNNPILLVGMSSLINDKRDTDKAFKYFSEETHNSDIYTISLMSETDDVLEIIQKYNNDLILAGNSLNGEIRIPLLGGVIKTDGSSTYKDPYYKLDNTDIYVSSGIGSPNTGVRLFNRPSINFFRLSNK